MATTRKSAAGSGKSSTAGTDQSVEEFRSALERSITLSRERIQEVVDEAVARGRMTRGDANEIVSKLVARGRRQTEEMLAELGKVAKTARVAADEPIAQADKLRRRAGVGSSFPITGYDELTVAQVSSRLADLTKPELRKVRTYERNNKGRKGILTRIEARLG
jgi:polyhydroxyalkanoate synthesis regulator phasin